LRELALRQAAHEVEQRIAGEQPAHAAEETFFYPRKQPKILILVTSNPKTAMLIRRAKRVGDFLGAECYAVTVQATGDLSAVSQQEREAIEQQLNFARNLHIETRVLEGEDVAETVVEFGRRNDITQIYLTRPREQKWFSALNNDPAQKIISLA